MGDVFNVVITTIQSLNRTQMSRTKTCLHRWMCVVCACVVWCARVWCGVRVCGVACTWHGCFSYEGKQVRQFFKLPKHFSFNEKQDK